MAVIPMALAVSQEIASAAEYNKVRQNILDMDVRITTTEGANANTRLNALESLTTNTATNGGQGNARLADRFGTGVGTGSNVTTGSASSQLADLRARAAALEAATGGAAPYGIVLATSPGQVITSSTSTVKVTFNSTALELRGLTWDAANHRFVCTAAGLYLPQAAVCFPSNANLARFAEFRKNGTIYEGSHNQIPSSPQAALLSVNPNPIPIRLAVNDYVEVWAGQNSASSLTLITTSGARGTFSLTYLAS